MMDLVTTAARRLAEVPDPTRNWKPSQFAIWAIVGLALGCSVAVDRMGVEYDFSTVAGWFQVDDCRSNTDLCDGG